MERTLIYELLVWKEKENRTGDGDTDGTVPDVSVAAIRREEGA